MEDRSPEDPISALSVTGQGAGVTSHPERARTAPGSRPSAAGQDRNADPPEIRPDDFTAGNRERGEP